MKKTSKASKKTSDLSTIQHTNSSDLQKPGSSIEESTLLAFYGGVGTIGGNKIAVIGGNHRGVLLDFGLDFSLGTDYLDSFMQLRDSSILNDSFITGSLPVSKGILEGIYFPNYFNHEKAQITTDFNAVGGDPVTIREILISHAHSDHIGYIWILHPNISPVCSKITQGILQYLDDVQSASSSLTGVLSTKEKYTPKGRGAKGIPEIPRAVKALNSSETIKCAENGFLVTLYLVDHSIPGASAYLIEDLKTQLKIAYTGDIRQHGPCQQYTAEFLEAAKNFKPDVLLIEGTRVLRENQPSCNSEEQVIQDLTTIFQKINQQDDDKLILFDCSVRDIWRIQSFYQATQSIGRTLILPAKIYELLKRMAGLGILNGMDLDDTQIKAYLPKKVWGLYEKEDYSYSPEIQYVFPDEDADPDAKMKKCDRIDLDKPYKTIAADVKANPGNYVLMLPFYSMIELLDIRPPTGSYYISSKSEPFDDEGEIEVKKRDNWLKLFGIDPSTHLFQVHCSGHASQDDIERMINYIHPKIVFPIHTGNPEEFLNLNLPEIKVVIPEKEILYDIRNLIEE